jgi:hypothetical protein
MRILRTIHTTQAQHVQVKRYTKLSWLDKKLLAQRNIARIISVVIIIRLTRYVKCNENASNLSDTLGLDQLHFYAKAVVATFPAQLKHAYLKKTS